MDTVSASPEPSIIAASIDDVHPMGFFFRSAGATMQAGKGGYSMRFVFGFVLWTLCATASADVVIHAGRMFDVNSGEVLEEQTIVVEGRRM